MSKTVVVEEEPQPGFYSTGRELAEAGYTPEEIVAELIDVPDFRPTIISILASSTKMYFRQQARHAEDQAFPAMKAGNTASAKSYLNAHTFVLPSGEFVEWTKATVEQHLARAAWFSTRIKGMQRTKLLHEMAAAAIETAGVKNLSQVKSVTLAPELKAAMVGEIE